MAPCAGIAGAAEQRRACELGQGEAGSESGRAMSYSAFVRARGEVPAYFVKLERWEPKSAARDSRSPSPLRQRA